MPEPREPRWVFAAKKRTDLVGILVNRFLWSIQRQG